MRYWSEKLGFPSTRVYRVVAFTARDAQFYEIFPATARDSDAHNSRAPVRWDGLVGDAISILLQSGRDRLRYQTQFFFPICTVPTTNQGSNSWKLAGKLSAVIRVDETSLYGHTFADRRLRFQRWLLFVRHQAATLLRLLDDPAAVERELSIPPLPIQPTAYRLTIRNRKPVFEFAKASLQLLHIVKRLEKRKQAHALRRMSQHVQELASLVGVKMAKDNIAVIVWWIDTARQTLVTYDYHAQFPEANDEDDSRPSVIMSPSLAARFQQEFSIVTARQTDTMAAGSRRIQKAFHNPSCYDYGYSYATVGQFVADNKRGQGLTGVVEVVFPATFNRQRTDLKEWRSNMIHFLTYVCGVLSAWNSHREI